jgi:hypothetical protein
MALGLGLAPIPGEQALRRLANTTMPRTVSRDAPAFMGIYPSWPADRPEHSTADG